MRWLNFFSGGTRPTRSKSHPQSRTRRLVLEPLEDRRVLTAIQLVSPGGLAGNVTVPKSNAWSLADSADDFDSAEAFVRENWLPNGYVHTVKSRGFIRLFRH